jgi:hypothetical protein
VLQSAVSNAELYQYKKNHGNLEDHAAVANMLMKAKSKDHLQPLNNNIREKYMLIAGAQRVLQGGRQDKDRLLMDRYKR